MFEEALRRCSSHHIALIIVCILLLYRVATFVSKVYRVSPGRVHSLLLLELCISLLISDGSQIRSTDLNWASRRRNTAIFMVLRPACQVVGNSINTLSGLVHSCVSRCLKVRDRCHWI